MSGYFVNVILKNQYFSLLFLPYFFFLREKSEKWMKKNREEK